MVLTVGGDPSADDDQIVACEIYISGQLLDSQYRRGKDVTVTCSYSSWQQEPFNGREVDLPEARRIRQRSRQACVLIRSRPLSFITHRLSGC